MVGIFDTLPFAPPEMVERLEKQKETGELEPRIAAPFAATLAGREEAAEYEIRKAAAPIQEIPEYVRKGLLAPVGLGEWTMEEMEAWPLTPEGKIHPESPLFQFITAPGEKITELVKEKPYIELGMMPSPGVALPGVGEIKMPDVFGGLKDVGKYALIGIAVISGVVLLSSYLKGRKK